MSAIADKQNKVRSIAAEIQVAVDKLTEQAVELRNEPDLAWLGDKINTLRDQISYVQQTIQNIEVIQVTD